MKHDSLLSYFSIMLYLLVIKRKVVDGGMKMEYKQRLYHLFSACGLNCGLCPRHQTDGISKCPGCAGEGFMTKHPPCGVLSCCQRHGLEHCYLRDEYPCKSMTVQTPLTRLLLIRISLRI